MARQVDEARLAKVVADIDMWTHAPGRLDLYGIDTPAERPMARTKVVPAPKREKILINKPSSEIMSLWGKVNDTPDTEDMLGLGMYLEKTHVAGLVLNTDELPRDLLDKMSKEGSYSYISSDALKKIGENIRIGESIYTSSYVMDALKVLGKEDITIYNAKDHPLLMVNKKGMAIAVAPCIGVDVSVDLSIPLLKAINMTPAGEIAERKRKRELSKNMKEGVEKFVKELERKGINIDQLVPYGIDEKPYKDKINYIYRKIKKNPQEYEQYAIKLFDRLQAFELGPGDKDLVSYKKTPPEWWTQTDGLGLDKEAHIVNLGEYTKIVGSYEKKREEHKVKQAKIDAGIKRGYKQLLEVKKKLEIRGWEDREREPDEVYRYKQPQTDEEARKFKKHHDKLQAIENKIKSLEYKHGAWHLQVKG